MALRKDQIENHSNVIRIILIMSSSCSLSSSVIEELEALQSIYSTECLFFPPASLEFRFLFSSALYTFTLHFPLDYPDHSHLLPDFSSLPLTEPEFAEFSSTFSSFHLSLSLGSLNGLQTILSIKEALEVLDNKRVETIKLYKENEEKFKQTQMNQERHNQEPNESREAPVTVRMREEIKSGIPLVDRRSFFQAHFARVSNVEQVNKIKEILLSDAKIRRATHNITAYRIKRVDPTSGVEMILQENEDDGEDKAGQRLAKLLELMGAENVFLMVSRWFGGILLGPERFKHINQVATTLLEENGVKRNSNKSKKEK
jgi:hypothetical protein